MGKFVQTIEMQTSRIEEIESLLKAMRARLKGGEDGPSPRRANLAADRDRPGHYVNIIEFDSYETAMENSARPETGELAEQLAKLCDSPPVFHNLDVRVSWEPTGG
jgi:hypothetical protein